MVDDPFSPFSAAFERAMAGDEIIRSIIAMARALGLQVIAEGVETAEQRDLLAREGCELYQGFLCSPPADAAALAVLVKDFEQ